MNDQVLMKFFLWSGWDIVFRAKWQLFKASADLSIIEGEGLAVFPTLRIGYSF
jgi:hypothetical protein